MRSRIDIFCCFLILAAPTPAMGGESFTGREIIARAVAMSALGLKTAIARIKMVLQDAAGQKRERLFILRSKVVGDRRKMIMKFLSPPDVAGTGLLLVERSKTEHDQFLFLPETGKVRRIAGKQNHASFLSSDFLYWDLKHHDVDEASHKRLADETVSGIACRVVRSTPHADADAPYSAIVTWVAVSNDVPVKMEFYDFQGKKIKRLLNSRIEKKQGHWVVMESKMTDLRRDDATLLLVETVEFKRDILDDEFTKIALQRVE